jgi:hypothetical protein
MRSIRIIATACAAVIVATLGSPLPLRAAQTVSCSTSGTRTTCRIDQPTVTTRVTTYPQIVFKPGDVVNVSAGGCVQTGGHGKTWKRYVNPSGPNSDRLYHGLIQIPGVQSDLVRIAGVVGHAVKVPNGVPANAPLRLGYEDDGYGDNGYWGHDDGTENQCRNVGDAFVVLTIDHNAGPVSSAAAPFDLVFTSVDDNVFPLNPQWAYQRDHNGALPDADVLCFPLNNVFSNPACTTQSPSLDVASGWNAIWCAAGASHSIHGHVNWMPATWHGPIVWDGHSSSIADDDYNVNLTPPSGAGLTASSGGTIHSEFDSDETIDHFTTPWWKSFHSAVDDSDAKARAMIDGKDAILIGLAGLDCEHGCATEIHPVYAMAVHVKDDLADDTWAIFVRNSGDEGYCSQDQHYLDANRIAFVVPRPSAASVAVNRATFLTNNTASSGPAVSLVAGSGAVVAFGLPDPSAGARINGELHLRWTLGAGAGAALVARPVAVSAAARPNEAVESEARLSGLTGSLPAQRRAALNATLARTAAPDATPLGAATAATSVKPTRRANVRAIADAQKAQRDLKRAQALCTAYDRNVPNAPANACAGVPQ